MSSSAIQELTEEQIIRIEHSFIFHSDINWLYKLIKEKGWDNVE